MSESTADLLSALKSQFGGSKVVVIGDCMLDRYIWGTVGRISPEAPVPIVHQSRTTSTGGGAANVAINLSRLGLEVSLAGFVGADAEAEELRSVLSDNNVDGSALLSLNDRPTITKSRIMGGNQQMLRLDRESQTPLPAPDLDRLSAAINILLQAQPAIVVLSDYAKGALPKAVCQGIIDTCKRHNISVVVDPKGDDFGKYKGATMLSPNRNELALGAAVERTDLESLLNAAQVMVADLSLQFMVVTLGDLGLALVDGEHVRQIPAVAKDVFDVSGAGDTVIATLAAGLAADLTPLQAVTLANIAGGIVVGKVGTAPISRVELENELAASSQRGSSNKIVDINVLVDQVRQWQERGRKVVFTNGCFDLLHPGHVAYLGAAARLGDHLVVGLNTDRSVHALKGDGRPVMTETDRSAVLAGLTSVDKIILFDDDTPLSLIKALKPDVLAKGADYVKADIVGAQEVESYGGEVALIPLVEGASTSRIIERMTSGGRPD